MKDNTSFLHFSTRGRMPHDHFCRIGPYLFTTQRSDRAHLSTFVECRTIVKRYDCSMLLLSLSSNTPLLSLALCCRHKSTQAVMEVVDLRNDKRTYFRLRIISVFALRVRIRRKVMLKVSSSFPFSSVSLLIKNQAKLLADAFGS